MRGVLPTAFVVGLTLTGCMQTPKDNCTAANRDITFGNLFNNSVNGRYDACLNDLQRELDALRLEANVLQAEAQSLNAEAARLSGERQTNARRLAHMNAEQAQLMRQLSSASEDRRVNEAELRAVLRQQEALREQLQNVSPSSTDTAELAALERQHEDISRRILRLTGA